MVMIEYGDIIIFDDKHRLMCGDSTKEDDVKMLLDGELADMMVTDPPYGINYQSGSRKESFEILKNDDKILDFTFVMNYLKDNSNAYIWTSHHKYPEWRFIYEKWQKITSSMEY